MIEVLGMIPVKRTCEIIRHKSKRSWCGFFCLYALSASAVSVTVDFDSPAKEIPPPIIVASHHKPEPIVDPAALYAPDAADEVDPRRLVRYFCRMWKDEAYTNMYWAMTAKYRNAVSFEKFQNLFESDAERSGGLKDENIVIDDVDNGKEYVVSVCPLNHRLSQIPKPA